MRTENIGNNPLKRIYQIADSKKATIRQSYSGAEKVYTIGYFEGPYELIARHRKIYFAAI